MLDPGRQDAGQGFKLGFEEMPCFHIGGTRLFCPWLIKGVFKVEQKAAQKRAAMR